MAGASNESSKNTATSTNNENFEPTSSSKSTAFNINDAIFTKLCGYGLYKFDQKKDAIVSFLSLSSVTSAFTDSDIVDEVKKLCDPLKASLQAKSKRKGERSTSTSVLPGSWKGLTCADFIV